jgi:hypothetical protein
VNLQCLRFSYFSGSVTVLSQFELFKVVEPWPEILPVQSLVLFWKHCTNYICLCLYSMHTTVYLNWRVVHFNLWHLYLNFCRFHFGIKKLATGQMGLFSGIIMSFAFRYRQICISFSWVDALSRSWKNFILYLNLLIIGIIYHHNVLVIDITDK